jgi:hypothetical protein
LDLRSHTSRSLRAGLARVSTILLAIAACAGCQSNSDRDLIARDRRMQEDQIYAMQDYINQYQQLVRRYRSENCELKRQLAEGSAAEPQPSEPQLPSRLRESSSLPKAGPQFQSPQTPTIKETAPSTPPPVDTPEVPPLKTTTSGDAPPEATAPVLQAVAHSDDEPRVLTASYYDEPARNASPSSVSPMAVVPADGESAAAVAFSAHQPSNKVLLSGEVVANETGGGPRLVVDVVPYDQAGHLAIVDDNVSLMLLAPGPDGRKQSIGRWDFGPDDVRAAIDTNAAEPSMRYYIELPAGFRAQEATEMWVRVVPGKGAKMLAQR